MLGTRGFGYQPALDGVRALAVALVLVFHQGWLDGGYVGVSVFFTLSGYLITSLALVEHDRTGRLDVGAFYGRRIRRLLPASLACLAGIVVLAWSGVFDAVEDLRRDIWAALAQVYNWVALSGGQTYADLVAGGDGVPSPLDHYWSLAIEEQFYWLWPLAMVAVLRSGRRGRVLWVGALTLAGALAAPLIAAVWGGDAAYWATPARLGEILVGALVAVILHGRWSTRPLPRAVAWFGVGGAGVVAWAAVTWPAGSGPAYEGWLPVFALATAGVVVGLQVPSPLRRLLSWRPLVALGTISYGVYLYHWPVYVVVDEFAVRIVLTIALAAVSFRLLERPIRTGGLPRPALAGVAACSALALVVAIVPLATAPSWMQSADAATLAPADSVVELRAVTTTTTSTTTTTTQAPASTSTTTPSTTLAPTTTTTVDPYAAPALPTGLSRPVRIVVTGDSTAMATGGGLQSWAEGHPDVAQVAVAGSPACGFVRGGHSDVDEVTHVRDECVDLIENRLPEALRNLQPDVVVGMVAVRDIEDRAWDDAEGRLPITDPRFAERLIADYDAATTAFEAAGVARVLWVLAPLPAMPLLDAARYDAYGAALGEVVARHPGRAAVVDLRGWMAQQPVVPERPDGLHWSEEAAVRVAADYLGPVVVAAAVT